MTNPRPIPKWAAPLNHIPVGEDEPGWAFYLQDPVSGIAWGFDTSTPCWCFGSGTGETIYRAIDDHHRSAYDTAETRACAAAILAAMGYFCVEG
jgi:hypothetical protein